MKTFRTFTVLLFFQLLWCFTLQAQDWPNLKYYQAADEQLKQDSAKEIINAVFMGNSITEAWFGLSPAFFSDNHFAGRGISGQTSPQMLLRFRQDVIDLHPKVVVIECGTNDIAGNTGPMTLEMTEANIISMAELAKENHIKVVLGSVLPSTQFWWRTDVQPADSIIKLNDWIKAYAKKSYCAYLNYYDALVNKEKGMKGEYSSDGVHPNKEGYRVMEKIASPVILELIGK